MKKFKILSTADNHLLDAQWGKLSRRKDFQDAFTSVIDQAIALNVSAIVNSGDLINSVRPSPANIKYLYGVNERLKQASLPMYLISGNHDLTYPSWIEAFQDTEDQTSGIIVIDNKSITIPGTPLTVHGIPYCRREEFLERQDSLEPHNILLWHGSVKEFVGNIPMDCSLTIADFDASKFDFISVGDIHVRKVITKGDCLISSPGSTELKQSNEDYEKTVTMVTFDEEDGVVDHEFIPIRHRVYRYYKLIKPEEVDAAVEEIESIADQRPIIFVDYEVGLKEHMNRIRTAVRHEDSFVNSRPFVRKFAPDPHSIPNQTQADDKRPEDFLSMFAREKSDMFTVASMLVNPEADAKAILEEFVEKTRKTLDLQAEEALARG